MGGFFGKRVVFGNEGFWGYGDNEREVRGCFGWFDRFYLLGKRECILILWSRRYVEFRGGGDGMVFSGKIRKVRFREGYGFIGR